VGLLGFLEKEIIRAMIKKSWFCIFLVLFIGCATMRRPVVVPFEREVIIDASFDKSWEGIIEILSGRDVEVETLDKEKGFIKTVPKQISREELLNLTEVPHVVFAVWFKGRYSLSFFAQRLGVNRTRIKISSSIEGYDGNATYRWHVCSSKGVLEEEIISSIKTNGD
jgi:hypothetical protein